MKDMKTLVVKGLIVLTVALFVLKVVSVFTWSWYWVFAPLMLIKLLIIADAIIYASRYKCE